MNLVKTFTRNVKPGDTILDVGANEGGYCWTFRSDCPDTTIHAFEPYPPMFQKLSERFADDPKIHCWHLGVGAKREVIQGVSVHEAWTIHKPGETQYSRNPTWGNETFDMTVTTVDSFLLGWPQAGGNVSAIKIDTDGYDFRVLQGAVETIQRCRPRILIEVGYLITALDGQDATEDLLNWIWGMKYRIFSDHLEPCDPNTRDWYPYKTTRDFLLVPSGQELNPVE